MKAIHCYVRTVRQTLNKMCQKLCITYSLKCIVENIEHKLQGIIPQFMTCNALTSNNGMFYISGLYQVQQITIFHYGVYKKY